MSDDVNEKEKKLETFLDELLSNPLKPIQVSIKQIEETLESTGEALEKTRKSISNLESDLAEVCEKARKNRAASQKWEEETDEKLEIFSQLFNAMSESLKIGKASLAADLAAARTEISELRERQEKADAANSEKLATFVKDLEDKAALNTGNILAALASLKTLAIMCLALIAIDGIAAIFFGFKFMH
ncbi:hypothetical protein [Gluconobacter oxydans]|uniref:hypothetical protein n=1 Tax=Gluconobacter oxydans TaxID=442 RepID=UPI00041CF97B|nr:hypothetical protein [Gluconobacter oxydans]